METEKLNRLLEEQRNLMIETIGYQKWYEILAIEDQIKSGNLQFMYIIDKIVEPENVKPIYAELQRLRYIRNEKFWNNYMSNNNDVEEISNEQN